MGRPMKFEPDVAVDKAAEVFWRQGYSGTTPLELVNELGIGKGSLYNSFESKHNLFTVALRRYCVERLEDLGEGLGDGGPMRPKLRAAIERLAGIGVHERGCFLVNSVAELGHADEIVAEAATRLFDGIELAFQTAIETAQIDGEFGLGRKPQELASSLLATVVGASVLAKAGGNQARLGRVVDAAVESL